MQTQHSGTDDYQNNINSMLEQQKSRSKLSFEEPIIKSDNSITPASGKTEVKNKPIPEIIIPSGASNSETVDTSYRSTKNMYLDVLHLKNLNSNTVMRCNQIFDRAHSF